MQMFQIISWTSAFPPKLGPAMCGVIRTFSIFQRGDVSGNGSVSNTSRTAPFKWPSSSTLIRSSIGMRLPLPTLTRIASFSWNTAVRNSEGLCFRCSRETADHNVHFLKLLIQRCQIIYLIKLFHLLQMLRDCSSFIPVTCVSNAFILWAIFLPISPVPRMRMFFPYMVSDDRFCTQRCFCLFFQ